MGGMGKGRASLAVLACLAFACGEGGTIIAQEGGASDATEGHDIVFVQQTSGDGGDATMGEDATGPSDAGGDGDEALPQLGPPTFSHPPSGSSIVRGTTVLITPPGDLPGSGSVRYTTDGATPGDQSTVYDGGIVVLFTNGCDGETETVKAIATAPGYLDSPVASASYVNSVPESGTVLVVFFSQQSSTQNNDFSLSLSAGFGATICYTSNGITEPTCDDAGACTDGSLTYSAPLHIDGTTTHPTTAMETVTALFCFPGWLVCGTGDGPASQTFILAAADPTMTNPPPGLPPWTPTGITPTLATTTVTSNEPVSIHMTTDGTTPTCTTGTAVPGSSTVGPFTSSTTVKAIACKTGYLPSNVVPFVYSVELAPPFLSSQNATGAGLPGWSWAGTGNPVTSMLIPAGATTPYGPFVAQQVSTAPCTGTAGAPEPSSCTGPQPPLADFICWSKTGVATCSCASPIALTPAMPTATLPASANVGPGDTLSVIACQSTPPVNATGVFAASAPTTVSF